MTLLVRVSILPDELTQRSFLSRLAGVNGCPSAAQFCKEMGLDWIALGQGQPDQLSILAELSGAEADAVRRNAIRQICRGSYEIRGCHVLPNMLRIDEFALCPSCIKRDVSDGTYHLAYERAYLRVPWHLRSIQTCMTHAKALVTFPLKNMRPHKRQFSVFGWDAAIELSNGWTVSADQSPTDFEVYLSGRLNGEVTGTWLDDMPFSEVTRLCQAIGGSILSGVVEWRSTALSLDRRSAENAGYQLLRQGPEALHEYLKTTMVNLEISPNLIGLRSILGPAKEFLINRKNETTDFGAFRQQMAQFSESFLNLNSSRIRLNKSDDGYTVGYLANQFGLDKSALMRAAQRIGAAISADDRLDVLTSRRIVREARHMWVSWRVRSYLGISHEQLWALADGGLLGEVKRGGYHKANRRFDPMVVEDFLATVMSAATRGSAAAQEWISLSEAAARFRCGLAVLVRLLLDSSLYHVIHDGNLVGLAGIRICAGEAFRKIFAVDWSGISMRETARRLGTTFEVISALLAEGFLLYQKFEKGRATLVFVSEASISEFEQKYVSLTNLSKAYGISTRRLNSNLAQQGISPAISSSRCGATFFHRPGLLT